MIDVQVTINLTVHEFSCSLHQLLAVLLLASHNQPDPARTVLTIGVPAPVLTGRPCDALVLAQVRLHLIQFAIVTGTSNDNKSNLVIFFRAAAWLVQRIPIARIAVALGLFFLGLVVF